MDLWFISCALSAQEINLAGEWEVALDSLDIGVTEKWADRSFLIILFYRERFAKAGMVFLVRLSL